MRVPIRLVGSLFLSVVTAIPLFAQTDIARVVHTPISFVNVGQPLAIEAYLENAQDRGEVESAQIWHKGRNDDVYDFDDMVRSGNGWSGTIQPSDIPATGFDYYVEFSFSDGSSLTYPAADAQQSPVRVSVRTAESGAGGSPIVLISPEPFSNVEGDVLIAVAFNQSVRLIDPQKVRLVINGKNRTSNVKISEEILIGVVPGIKAGRVRVDINYLGDKGTENLGNFAFTHTLAGTRKGPRQDFSGNFTNEARTQKVNAFEQRIDRQTINMNYEIGGFNIIANTMLTSEEQGSLQPQHRYSVDAGTKGLRIRGGDIKPRYNELVLWGKRVRGLEFALDSRPFGLSVLYGYTKRGIDGREIINSSIDSTTQSTVLDTALYAGTYRRWLTAARLRFGNKDKFSLGIMAMKVKDDTTSILYGDAALDNVVTGASMSAFFDHRRFALSAEAALSITSNDYRTAPFDDAKDFADIIVINSYLDPLPNSGLPDSSGGKLDFMEVGKSILNQSGSYKARLRMRYLHNDIQVGYRKINRSYKTLGVPSLTTDRQGYFVRDRIRLFKSALYLNAGYDHFFDNVTGKGDVRNQYDLLSAGINIYPSPSLPTLAFSYSDYYNTNDGTLNVYEPSPGDTTINDTRQENRTGNWTFSITQAFGMGFADNNLSLIVQNSKRTNVFNTYDVGESQMMNASLRSRFEAPFISSVSYSSQKTNAVANLTDLTYQMLSARVDILLFNRKLVPFFGPRFTLGKGNNAMLYIDPAETLNPDDYSTPETFQMAVDSSRALNIRNMIVDFRRIDWLGGFRWEIFRNQTIEGMFSISSYLENSKFEYWNGDSFDVNRTIIENGGYTLTQPTPLDRNDVIASIQYQIRF
ncbi:MAG: hypothetical protein V2A56_02585 [bacterium]